MIKYDKERQEGENCIESYCNFWDKDFEQCCQGCGDDDETVLERCEDYYPENRHD